ncbi:calcium-binding protein [Nocardioides sp. NPDC126508]
MLTGSALLISSAAADEPAPATCGGMAITVDIGAGGAPTDGDDVILGTPGVDVIHALGGHDVICGLGGGSVGADIDQVYGEGGDDLIIGSSGTDYMRGGDGNDVFRGNGGQDYYFPGMGDDDIIVAEGTVTGRLLYSDVPVGVNVDTSLCGAQVEAPATRQDTGAGMDSVPCALYQVSGSPQDDRLAGRDGRREYLSGGDGDDVLYGSDTEVEIDNDSYMGGAGTDTLDFSRVERSVWLTAEPSSGVAHYDAGVGIVSVSDIENLVGSTAADHLYAGREPAVLDGGPGDDWLNGGPAADAFVDSTARIISGATSAVTIDGTEGTFSSGDSFTVAPGVSVWGSGGNDVIHPGRLCRVQGGENDVFIIDDTVAPDCAVGDQGSYKGGILTLDALNEPATYALGDPFVTTASQSIPMPPVDGMKLIGTRFDDVLGGDAGDNTIDGSAGDDIIRGGAGKDTASYESAGEGVAASMTRATGGGGNDTMTDIENLTGSRYHDSLTGDAMENVLSGGDGDDLVSGGAGANVISGGAGNDTLLSGPDDEHLGCSTGTDTVSYAGAGSAIRYTNVNPHTADNVTGGGGNDRVFECENVTGSSYSDNITGTSAGNVLNGGGGNDILNGGAGGDIVSGGDGNDTLYGSTGNDRVLGGAGNDSLRGNADNDAVDGGSGTDTVLYDYATGRVTASMTRATGAGVGADTLAGVENVTGSGYPDTLTGNGLANVITGGGGDDTLVGAGGNDRLLGGSGADVLRGDSGNDTVDGGSGTDRASFTTATGGVTSTMTSASGGAGSDRMFAIENLAGGPYADRLTGSSAANVIQGGAGADYLYGVGGADRLYGNSSGDRLYGGAGTDYGDGGTGRDVAYSIERRRAIP